MGKKLLKTGIVSIIFATLLLGGYSCADDNLSDYEVRRMIEEALKENNQNLEFTEWDVFQYTIEKDGWEWNPDAKRYESLGDLPELTEYIYNERAVLGFVFILEQGKYEVQKTLPYWYIYQGKDETGNSIIKNIEISYDVEYASNGESTVAFYIREFNGEQIDEVLQKYYIRIVMIK